LIVVVVDDPEVVELSAGELVLDVIVAAPLPMLELLDVEKLGPSFPRGLTRTPRAKPLAARIATTERNTARFIIVDMLHPHQEYWCRLFLVLRF
jgi:hypothetical protein